MNFLTRMAYAPTPDQYGCHYQNVMLVPALNEMIDITTTRRAAGLPFLTL